MERKSSARKFYIAIVAIFFSLSFVLCPIYLATEVFGGEKTTDNKSDDPKDGEKAKAAKDALDIEESGDLYDYERPSAEEESYAWLIIKTIIVLGALVGGFYYFFKFVTKKTGINVLGEEVVKVLSIVPVGQNKFLQVVDIAGRVLVLGVTDSNINLITEVAERDEIDRIRLLSSKSTPIQPGGFQQYISKQLVKFFSKDPNKNQTEGKSIFNAEKNEMNRMDYFKKQKDRLKDLNGRNDEE